MMRLLASPHARACLTKHLWFDAFILAHLPTGDSSRGVRLMCVLVHVDCVCVMVEGGERDGCVCVMVGG